MLFEKPLFSQKYLSTKFQSVNLAKIANVEQKLACISAWKKSILNQAIIQGKEESLKASFLQQIFVEILEYSDQKDTGLWFLEIEQNAFEQKKVDGALGFFSIGEGKNNADVRVVIELKNAKTDLDKPQNRKNDHRTPIQQAFDYANGMGEKCRWVIVSNFKEIRLYYHTDRTRYQHFDLLMIDKIEYFKPFYLLLHKDRLMSLKGDSLTDKLYQERQAEELTISQKFYLDYKQARFDFFNQLKNYNPTIDPLILLNKTQKLLDRIIFIHFCEDYHLIESYTLRNLIKFCKEDKFNFAKDKLISRLKFVFTAINEGYPPLNINKFNGGLFAEDKEFDNLVIIDVILEPVLKLVDYDLASDLGVNILGHIFEQSISDIEALKADIRGEAFNKKTSKRKKDGIYYTPDYITGYIVQQAIGGWLKDRRMELNEAQLPELIEADFHSIKLVTKGKNKGHFDCNANIQKHIEFYQNYKKIVSEIKVLDPACGSGAFLNQAFDFLYAEAQRINHTLINLLYPAGSTQFNLDAEKDKLTKAILQNNLFGVDLNEESIEITKLSLWIKTASRDQELTYLDDTIKCGNSLIDDQEIAGKKAFVWQNEFPAIMQHGGFDVIIGNPPYVFARNENFSNNLKQYYYNKYKLSVYQINTYALFIERDYFLANQNGYIGNIIPKNWMTIDSFEDFRKFILNETAETYIVNLPEKVFVDANVNTCILIFKKMFNDSIMLGEFVENQINVFKKLKKETFFNTYKNIININFSNIEIKYSIINKIQINAKTLDNFAQISTGLKAYQKGKGKPKQTEQMIKNRIFHSTDIQNATFKKYLFGKNVSRYALTWNKEYLSYGEWLAEPRFSVPFDKERILVRQIPSAFPKMIEAIYTNEYYLNDINSMVIFDFKINPKFLLTILNSKLISFWFLHTFDKLQRKLFPQFKIGELKKFPIIYANEITQILLIEKADIMLEQNKNLQQHVNAFISFIQAELKPVKISTKLHKYYELNWDEFKTELKKAKVDFNKKFDLKTIRQWQNEFNREKQQALEIKTLIDQTDCEIDQMVYVLYGLTAEEIAVIEQYSL